LAREFELLSLTKRYHEVVSHDKGSLRFCMFRDGVQSFDPIIDRSRDLSHSVARSFCPNPRIRMQKRSKRQSHLSWDPSANLADWVTFANDWLSSLLITAIVKRFPAFTKILPESRLAFVQRLLLELPRMHAQGAPPSCFFLTHP
jgi:hypothetical protein